MPLFLDDKRIRVTISVPIVLWKKLQEIFPDLDIVKVEVENESEGDLDYSYYRS